MKTSIWSVAQRQVEALLFPWRNTELSLKPQKGWIRTIREGLGMSASFLARKMDVDQSTVKRYEEAEASGAISLKTLKRVADALDCELVYALVPRKTLSRMIQDQALTVARERMKSVSHTMALEDQSTSMTEQKDLLGEQVQALVSGSPRDLWR